MISYFLQVVFFQLLFLLVYEILLKRETFFTWNRWYLLMTAAITLLLPFIKLEELSFMVTPNALPEISDVWWSNLASLEAGIDEATYAGEISRSGAEINWWMILYFIGFCGSIYFLMRKYNELERLFRFRTFASEEGWQIIEIPNSNIACTFYKTIFLGDQLTENERQQIFPHELVHVKQRHSLDLVFFEFLKVGLWFNPLIYIYQKRIASLHEFIADAAAVKETGKRNYYEQLLNSAFSSRDISFINQFFSHSLIKKRIIMLQKSESKTIAKTRFLVVLPLMLLMLTFTGYSFEQEVISPDTSSEDLIIEVKDLDELSAEQKKLLENKVSLVMEKRAYKSLTVRDDKKTLEFTVDPLTGEQQGKIYHTAGKDIPAQPVPDVPFAVVDEVPVFPGCEKLETGEARKNCMAEKVINFVKTNISGEVVNLFTQPEGGNVTVIFRIDETGKVTGAKGRATSPKLNTQEKNILEQEAIKSVNSLPQMEPGKHNGQVVGVLYAVRL